jgi:enamine deaminase RidA (YjgF/YER057c/UK114 family)
VSAGDCLTVLRRFTGPSADEISILCRPNGHAADAAAQAEAAYRALADALTASRASFDDVAVESLFVRDIRRELPLVLGGRARVLADLRQTDGAPLPGFIGQPPVDGGVAFELLASAVVPHDRDARTVRDVAPAPSCPCEGCARSGARLIRLGVQGTPFPPGHECALSLQAVKSPRPLVVSGMSTPALNEAWSYGADFSRGLRVAEANRITLHVSGTASIDEAGRTVHAGDFTAQAERMLDNVESLLARREATFASLVSGVTYLKRAADAPTLRTLYRRRGFEGFPCAVVEAGLCRPELLCETEVVALLPPAAAGA